MTVRFLPEWVCRGVGLGVGLGVGVCGVLGVGGVWCGMVEGEEEEEGEEVGEEEEEGERAVATPNSHSMDVWTYGRMCGRMCNVRCANVWYVV